MGLLTDRVVRRLPDLARVVTRFPVAVAALIALTLYFLLDLHLSPRWSPEARFTRIPSALAAIALWGTAATLWVEARGRRPALGQSLAVAGGVLLGFVFWLANAFEITPWAMLASLALAVGLAPYATRTPANAAFWQFNHTLAVATLLAMVGVLLFAGGLSLVLETLRTLLGVGTPYRAHEKVWSVAGLLIGPVYALSLVPTRLDQPVADVQQGGGAPRASADVPVGDQFTSRAVAVLVRFVLVPLLLVLAAILHLAALKVLVDGELPRGRLGWLVLSFGTAAAVTALAAFPTRASGGPLVRFFWRAWPWLLIVPLGLLWVALAVRVDAYGWTTDRYVAALAGVWLASLVVTQGLIGRLAGRLDLRLVPGILALLLAIASLGPWGATGMPVRSQARDFTHRLVAAGAIEAGNLVPDAAGRLSPVDRVRLGAILDHLVQQGRLGALRSLFDGAPGNPSIIAEGGPGQRSDLALADRIRARLDLARSPDAPLRTFALHPSEAATFRNLPPGSRLVGPVDLVVGGATSEREGRAVVPGPPVMRLTLAAGMLTVTDVASGRQAAFDVGAVVRDPARNLPHDPLRAISEKAIEIARRSGDLPAVLVLANGFARLAGDDIASMNATFWLVVGD